tara:strand:+ start:784 stop:1095 length:312 start_codon:yes stop_codon:yes gene_type:complete
MNYTQDQTEYLIEEYKNKPTRVTVDRLAKELNKSSKSIIGKLSREGVYQRNVYKTKAGEMPVTKVEIVHEIAECLNLSHETLAGLEKAPKAALKALQIAAGSN